MEVGHFKIIIFPYVSTWEVYYTLQSLHFIVIQYVLSFNLWRKVGISDIKTT